METTIIARIRQVIEHYQLNAAAFADKINIQRSALSHIFSERNKPSLDVIQKIISAFPEINTNWLLTGQESMFGLNNELKDIDYKENITKFEPDDEQLFTDVTNAEIKPEVEMEAKKEAVFEEPKPNQKKIEMITVFYSDKTFSVYHPDDLPPSLDF